MVSIIKSKLLEKRTELARAKSLNKNESGVTIVELMIVVAVAALIIVLVLVAAPALQRNARNTQRRNDISAVSGQINAYATNNNGALPPLLANFASGVVDQLELAFYTVAPAAPAAAELKNGIRFANSPNATTGPGVTFYLPTVDELHIYTGFECAIDGTTATTASVPGTGAATTAANWIALTDPATSRAFVMFYVLEGEPNIQCQDNS